MVEVEHEPANSRWVAKLAGSADIAFLEYALNDKSTPKLLDLRHTFTPLSMRGKGIAGHMVKAAFQYARANSMKVIPTCTYIPVWVRRNPDFADVVESPAPK